MTDNNEFDIGEDVGKPQAKKYVKIEYDIFLRCKPRNDKPYKIRIASNPRNFRSHWNTFTPIGIHAPVKIPAYSYDEKPLDMAWNEGDYMPQKRHACLVFDRDDNNRLKVLESGDSLFVAFGNWYKSMKVSPAGPQGTDWFVWVKKDGNHITYSAIADQKPSPFTEAEQALLDNCPIDLSKVIKIRTPEEIKELWMKLPDDKKYNPKSKYKSGQKFDAKEFEKKYGSTSNNNSSDTPQSSTQPSASASINNNDDVGEQQDDDFNNDDIGDDNVPF